MIKNNITKIDFAKNLSKKMGYPSSFSNNLINDLIIICKEMINDNDLTLKNIGTFKLIKKRERLGRNPKTDEEYLISERNSIRFIVSKNLSKTLNN